jgi:hypothetical protein
MKPVQAAIRSSVGRGVAYRQGNALGSIAPGIYRMSSRTLLRRLRDTRGQELVEMAIVTPILLVILAAIFDFGFLFRSWQVVTNAAREGARVGMLPAYSCTDTAPVDVQTRVDTYMAASGFPDPAGYLVTMAEREIALLDDDLVVCAVRVEMNQPLWSLAVFGQFFGGSFGSVPVVAMAEMRSESQTLPAP